MSETPPPDAQLPLGLPSWGGRRPGAGRKPAGQRTRAPHQARPRVSRHTPVHVTLRVRDYVWNLRSRRSFAVVEAALLAVNRHSGFLVAHFSVQGNHLHLIVEADDAAALSRGVRALAIRLARGLNRMMGRRGQVFEDRFHAHVLRSRAETRNALGYALFNFHSHASRRGEVVAGLDRFSSAAVFAGAGRRFPGSARAGGGEPATTRAPRSWLLRVGWRRG